MKTQTQTVKNPKKPYTSPKLVLYGDVRSLTQSGATAPAENMGGMKMSSRMTKENIVRIGTHPLGIGLYLFGYKLEYREKWGYGRQFGVMADEVETVMPEAVSSDPDGYKLVNYSLLGIKQAVH